LANYEVVILPPDKIPNLRYVQRKYTDEAYQSAGSGGDAWAWKT
jgi:hypothetical protein